MKIPMELLLDEIAYLSPEIHLRQRDRWIRGIKLMPRDEVGVDADYLYFCIDPGIHPLQTAAPYVAVRSMGAAASDGAQGDAVILPEGTDILSTFNDLLGFQNLLRDWFVQVELSLTREEGLQSLLDLCAKVIGNPIVILTAGDRLVATTPGAEAPDMVFGEILEKGYLSQEKWNVLRDNGFYRSEHYSGETVCFPPSYLREEVDGQQVTKPYMNTLTAIRHRDQTVFLVFMLCTNMAYTRGIAQLYGYALDCLKRYLQPLADEENRRRDLLDYLIADVLAGAISGSEELCARSSVAPQAFSAPYRVVVVTLSRDTDIYVTQASQMMEVLFPTVRQLIYGERVVLFPEDRLFEDESTFAARLEGYLAKADGFAGASAQVMGYEGLAPGYQQASRALELGRNLTSGIPVAERLIEDAKTSARLFRYERFRIYSLLAGGETDTGPIGALRAHDAVAKTDYYRILFVYLTMERNYTRAAEALHMHRNNVIYHVRRIVEQFHLELDDPEIRLGLLALYRLDDLLEAKTHADDAP